MVFSKLVSAGKWTAETARGAAVVLVSPNAPIPPTKLHPRMPSRPWTFPEWFRMNSWRYMWQYMPVVRFYLFSAVFVFGVFKIFVPIKPRHWISYSQGKQDSHHHEVEHWAGFRQKRQDKEYFAKYDPFRVEGAAAVGGH